MATKDEYYQRIIASLQADISSQNKAISDLKTTVARQQKEIEALKASQKPQQSPSHTNLPSEDKSQLLHQAKKECEAMIQTRLDLLSSRYVEKRELDTFRASFSKTYLLSDTFTAYKKTLGTHLKGIENKLKHCRLSFFSAFCPNHKFNQTKSVSLNIEAVVHFFKSHNLQWLLRILVFLSIDILSFYLFKISYPF